MLANKTYAEANAVASKEMLEAADVFETLCDALADALVRLGEEKAASMRRKAYELETPTH